jgi:hypothetical protein
MQGFAEQKVEEIRKAFFAGRRNVAIDPAFEGMRSDFAKRVLRFGLRCGCLAVSPSALLHEMGHFVVARSPRRMVASSFGMTSSVPFYWTAAGPFPILPRDAAYTRLEAEVWAWELVLSRRFGIDATPESLASSIAFTLDNLYIPGRTDDDKKAWVADLIREKAGKLTFEGFAREWDRRVRLIPGAIREADAFERLFDDGDREEVRRFDVEGLDGVQAIVCSWSLDGRVGYEAYVDDRGHLELNYQSMHDTLEVAERRLRRIFDGRRLVPCEATVPAPGLAR